MTKHQTEAAAKDEAILAANICGGTWGVIKYPHDYGVAKLQSDIRIDPTLDVVFRIGPIFNR